MVLAFGLGACDFELRPSQTPKRVFNYFGGRVFLATPDTEEDRSFISSLL